MVKIPTVTQREEIERQLVPFTGYDKLFPELPSRDYIGSIPVPRCTGSSKRNLWMNLVAAAFLYVEENVSVSANNP